MGSDSCGSINAASETNWNILELTVAGETCANQGSSPTQGHSGKGAGTRTTIGGAGGGAATIGKARQARQRQTGVSINTYRGKGRSCRAFPISRHQRPSVKAVRKWLRWVSWWR